MTTALPFYCIASSGSGSPVSVRCLYCITRSQFGIGIAVVPPLQSEQPFSQSEPNRPMNEIGSYHEPTRQSPPPGWICDISSSFPEEDEAICTATEQARPRLEEMLEEHAGENGLRNFIAHMDGITSRDVFGNGSVHTIDAVLPVADNVRPGSSLRLSQWGMQAARTVGMETPSQLEGTFAYRRSNALARKYTQWHTTQTQ